MANKLPPVQSPSSSSKQPACFGPSLYELPADHPFDGPYRLLKSLRMDINELQGALQSERNQRVADVTRLNEEIMKLRGRFDSGQAEHVRIHEEMDRTLDAKAATLENLAHQLHDQLATRLDERVVIVDDSSKTLRAEIDKISNSLADTCMEYRKVCDELDSRISANLAADQRFAGEIAHDLADLRRKLATVYDDKHQRAAEVGQLQLEGSQLRNKLAQEIDDRAAACNFLGRSLAMEASQSEQVVRELRTTTSVSLRLHRKAALDDTNVLHNQIKRLEQGLDRKQQISNKVTSDMQAKPLIFGL